MTEADLLAAIAAAPDDDAPRLVYADWLQDRGDARGELIAADVRCWALPPFADGRDDALRRRAELLRAHGAAWLAPLEAAGFANLRFRRGLVEHAVCGGEAPAFD